MTTTLTGSPVSPGRAAGVVVTMPEPVPEPPTTRLHAHEADAAVEAVRTASTAVQKRLVDRADRARGTAADVLSVTAAMAGDPTLASDAERRVREDLVTPARAVWDAAGSLAAQLEQLGPPLAERARDVRDVRDRIVAELTGARPPGVPEPGHPFVLVAEDLAPADTATLDPETVLGIVTSGGGPTSHTAILARSLGIPAVVAVAGAGDLRDGETVLLDGGSGSVVRDPDPDAVAAAQHRDTARRELQGPGRTADGVPVELMANVADPDGARAAAEAGAEGVGLFRTEFCFLGRAAEPSVAEQVSAYRRVLAAFPGRRVVVRTLDAGADKPLGFVTADDEPNPALGVRGLRTAVGHPDVLDRQLQAIAEAAAAEEAEVWVMAPMVATPAEARDFVAACAKHGLEQAGVMVEVPAAALRARWIFEHAAFGSLGTNDLIQYAMAADRVLGELATLSTPWQPAVLELVRATCEGAAAHGRPVGVCGEAAADPALAPVLVGLGVSSLSMTPRALGDVAAVLGATTSEECAELARLACEQPDAESARAAVRGRLAALLDELAL
ncbi:phosphoenolpyruvate--protein phosphotransferase [Isoptericola variabilis]|uniref:Phosphoenolpyruvate-protein phosphotransferase n=1 Tax=Isoptericola variabilis (strain 225) TaxID=743718 RepID=F6FSU0_ISOV2|nr:phosphoenolpyruvate--protein phosphotransferase [Isoptericola variabilis]AEG43081.1 phosphoenolpyruvate-protein phosphotransferase [Isoptericola variabilis 225]TWH35007.1 phosphotransferase system enzyme I (PtsI) [Isoptericola variabilis J7]